MAEFSARRVVAIAAIAGAVVGGAVASGVAEASNRGSHDSTTSSSGGGTSVTTAAVVRTTLTSPVQVGGSIGYDGSYAIAAPSGSSAQQVAQAQETVTLDQQTLFADEQSASDASIADDQQISADQTNVTTDRSISSDQTQLTQAEQQLVTAESTATRDHDQNQTKVASDQTKLQGDQATLASTQAMAVNSGTTYTWLPKVGVIIEQDQPVYSVSNQPVPLLYGSIAAYRAFYLGMSDGADVGQLTHVLIALGDGAGLTQSNHYSSATATAVSRLQTALGLPATGEVLLGQVVFEPGPIRVTSVTPSVGASIGGGGGGGSGVGGGGTVLTATSTTPIVTIDLDVTQEYLVKPGDAVSIVLPDGTSSVGGHVETVGNVATCPGGAGAGGSSGGGSADQSPCSSSGSGNSSTPTVTVTITLDSTSPLATLDQAPVNVNITSQSAPNVLAVPVNALLALQNGGYGVDVVTGNSTQLVGVTTGLYSNTLVQVSGSGLTVGTRVEVPSS